MQITLAIATFNRFETLRKMSDTLALSSGIERDNVHIRIYDDHSNEFTVEQLWEVFPNALSIVRRDKNMGANANMHHMYLDFLATDDDLFIHTESDLLFHPDWLKFVAANIDKTDGVLCLYNAEQVPVIGEETIDGQDFVLKEYLDALGVVLAREHVQTIVDNCPVTETFDWDWSRYLREHGHRLLCSRRSWVQHIGLDGFNSDGVLYLHFGKQFYPGHPVVEKHLIDYYDRLLARNDAIVRQQIQRELEYTQQYIRVQEIACTIGAALLPLLRPINRLMKLTPWSNRFRLRVRGYLTKRIPW